MIDLPLKTLNFFVAVLFVALALLVLYLFSTFLTICWLMCPFWGRLARYMSHTIVRQKSEPKTGSADELVLKKS